ncbi:MAG: RNase adapter RapZ [Nitrospirae bacterium]|nr:RNase adapter RapZ [Nitrospirota bacterium]
MKAENRQVYTIFLTGLSGSGISIALNAFQDGGFFCVDNLPTTLIEAFIDLCKKTPSISKIAVGVDIRERKFLDYFSDTLADLRKTQKMEIIFLEASEDVLIRRFKETRRPHPLGYKDLKRALRKEAQLLKPIRDLADKIIDTSTLSPHQLRKLITKSYLTREPSGMSIGLVSFGYKYGIPPEADLLFDVRFLPNPYFIKELKALPGTSAKVRRFVLSQEAVKEFFDKLNPLLDHLIPLYQQEGKSYLTIGIGCTGGKHRSPVIVEEIGKFLKKKKLSVSVTHRDMQEKLR